MGYERKRGKLAELNALLRGCRKRTASRSSSATTAVLVEREVRDHARHRHAAAARRGAAVRRRDGASAQPPALRHHGQAQGRERVTEGYGILQPRVSVEPARREPLAVRAPVRRRARDRSVHARRLRRLPGRVRRRLVHRQGHLRRRRVRARARRPLPRQPDPQPRPARGLLRALGAAERRAAVRGLPVHATAPTSRRRHRWIRGDWQLAGWLLPRVPGPGARRRARTRCRRCRSGSSSTTCGAAWSRSALTLLLLLGWTVLRAGLALDRWRCSAILAAAVGERRCSLDLAAQAGRGACCGSTWSPRSATAGAARGAGRRSTLAFLPYEATVSLDAIARTGWRMLVSHRRLLEWNPSAADEADRRRDGAAGRSALAASPGRCGSRRSSPRRRAILLALRPRRAGRWPRRSSCLWLVSPGIAWWISRPLARREAQLTRRADACSCARSRAGPGRSSRRSSARTTTGCRRTTSRSIRSPRVAHRTSPTNMGLALLANLTAYDFGYIPAGQLRRSARANALTHDGERWSGTQGHFYNWYDTQTLQPLPPLYVSTVDSGNLAGHLLTLRPGLLALRRRADRGRRGGSRAWATRCACSRDAAGRLPRRRRSCACSATWSPPSTRGRPRIAAARRWLDRLRRAASREVAARGRGAASTPRPAPRQRSRATGLLGRGARPPVPTHARRARRASRRGAVPRMRRTGSAIPTAARHPDAARARGARSATHRRRPRAPRRPRRRRRSARGSTSATLRRGSEPACAGRIAEIERLARQCDELARMDYDFLYDRARHLLAIGYNVAERPARRELLRPARLRGALRAASSRSRRASCRRRTGSRSAACSRPPAAQPVLLSWSGSMFEYLMPLLVMPTYDEHAARPDLPRGGARGRSRTAGSAACPGASRSRGYNTVDASLNYQYRAFGVPGPGPQARPRRGPGRRALRLGARADGRARGGLREPAAARRRRARRPLRLLRGDRLHAGARCRAARRAPSCARSWRTTRA